MKQIVLTRLRRAVLPAAVLIVLAALAAPLSGAADAASPRTGITAFQPGEMLTYDVSWSKVVTAGITVMEVKREHSSDNDPLLRFVVTGYSVGAVDRYFPVHDSVLSVFDPLIMQSLCYNLRQSHGRRTKRRELVFDHRRKTITASINDEPPKTVAAPDPVQDPLSALYYLRTRDFAAGPGLTTIDLYDGMKTWSLEVHVLGRETVTTPAGEFAAIKLVAHTRSEGIFGRRGDIFLWLTDDFRRIPVLMRSRLTFGSIVMTLTKMKPGEAAR